MQMKTINIIMQDLIRELENIDLEPHFHENYTREEFLGKAGKEHYRFLAYLGTLFDNSNIIDIGTHRGSSARALSALNKTNHIHSFDIIDKNCPAIDNITYYVDNIFENLEKYEELILTSRILVLDVDPHSGRDEHKFYLYLKDKNYQGILILDDIYYFKEMRDNFWYQIPTTYKIDYTSVGHWSGTGLVAFNDLPNQLISSANELTKRDDSWTIVTAYIDLTKCPDASKTINSRPENHYLSTANTTMSLDRNLVVYCEEENVEKLWNLRPKHLHEKTRIISIVFDDFMIGHKSVKELREIIKYNRIDHPYNFDDRNIPSYYILCMLRYQILLNTMKENVLGSTHFAWVNICVERYHWSNARYLDEAFNLKRNKFSTCTIDYIPESLVNNLEEFWKYGRSGIGESGFFTGNDYYMGIFCKEIIAQFYHFLDLKVGHADEQLYNKIFFMQPEIFDLYYGDYNEMVINYCSVKSHPEKVVNTVIRNSYNAKDYTVCKQACKAVWKCPDLSENTKNRVREYLLGCVLNEN